MFSFNLFGTLMEFVIFIITARIPAICLIAFPTDDIGDYHYNNKLNVQCVAHMREVIKLFIVPM